MTAHIPDFLASPLPEWRSFIVSPPRSQTHRRYNMRDTRRTQAHECQRLVDQTRARMNNLNEYIPFGEMYPLGAERCISVEGEGSPYWITLWVNQTRNRGHGMFLSPDDDEFWQLLAVEAGYGVETAPQIHRLPITGDSDRRCLSVVFIRRRDTDRTNHIWSPVPEAEY